MSIKPPLIVKHIGWSHNQPSTKTSQRASLFHPTRARKHENLTKCIVNALSSYFQLSLQFDTLVILESVSALTIHRRCAL